MHCLNRINRVLTGKLPGSSEANQRVAYTILEYTSRSYKSLIQVAHTSRLYNSHLLLAYIAHIYDGPVHWQAERTIEPNDRIYNDRETQNSKNDTAVRTHASVYTIFLRFSGLKKFLFGIQIKSTETRRNQDEPVDLSVNSVCNL